MRTIGFGGTLLLAWVLCSPCSVAVAQPATRRLALTPPPVSPVRLLAMQGVQRELRLSARQQAGIRQLAQNLIAQRANTPPARPGQDVLQNFVANIVTITAAEDRMVQEQLGKLLSEDQAARLQQLTIQFQGVDVLATESMEKQLELTAQQRERIWRIREENYLLMNRQLQETLIRPGSAASLRARMEVMERESRRRAESVLTGEQRKKYKEMQGREFRGFVVVSRRGF